jgi:hypothetical protein
VPYEYRQLNYVVSADYRINRTNNLETTFERESSHREHREREKTWEDKIRFGYVNRGFEAGTLRVSYEYGHLRGSEFVATALDPFYGISLGPVPTAATTDMSSWLRNVDQFRRFDVADHNQHVVNAVNHGIGQRRRQRRRAGERCGVSASCLDATTITDWRHRPWSSTGSLPATSAGLSDSRGATSGGRQPYRDGNTLLLQRRIDTDQRDRWSRAPAGTSISTQRCSRHLEVAVWNASTSVRSFRSAIPGCAQRITTRSRVSASATSSAEDDRRLIHLFERPYEDQLRHNPAALGLNAGSGAGRRRVSDLVFRQNPVEANAIVRSTSRALRLL